MGKTDLDQKTAAEAFVEASSVLKQEDIAAYAVVAIQKDGQILWEERRKIGFGDRLFRAVMRVAVTISNNPRPRPF